MKNTLIAMDLAKSIFHVVIFNQAGKEQRKRKLRRSEVMRFFAQQEPCQVAMEACGTSHYWGRQLRSLGHQVVLLPPQHVKAYQRGQKNDYNDARAIADAAYHGSIRPVRVKTVEQQDQQVFHRLRKRCSRNLTATSNQLRSLLLEYGIAIPLGINSVCEEIPRILEDTENGLSARCRDLFRMQYNELLSIRAQLQWYDEELKHQAKEDDICRRLCEIPGFGPVNSSAIKDWMGDGKQFKRGRCASAALGIIPRQHSSADKQRLGGITKRGDAYVRSLLIHGARSVVSRAKSKTDGLSLWINFLVARRGFNKAVVALANKMLRIAWVVIARNERYQKRGEESSLGIELGAGSSASCPSLSTSYGL